MNNIKLIAPMEMIKKLARGYEVINKKRLAELCIKNTEVLFCSIKQDGQEFEVFITAIMK